MGGWAEPSAAPAGRITVISGSVGAGHDGASAELSRRLRELGYAVDCHDFLDLVGRRTGRALRRAYAMELSVAPRTWGWLLTNLEKRDRMAAAVGRSAARVASARAIQALDGPVPPRVVVSTYPLASQVLGRLRRTGALAAPVVTFLTDLSVPALWIADGVDLHLALHEVAAAQVRHRCDGRIQVCAPAVRGAFRPAVDGGTEVARTRARYGLPPTGRLALLVGGSWGVGELAEAAADVASTGLATPVTVCGHNRALRARLSRAGIGVPLGWVDEMPALIRASDVVVQNAGGLTSLEAMAADVPVITYRCLPGHGTTNARALDEAGLARWVHGPARLAEALAGVLDGEPGRRQRAAGVELFAAPSPIDSIVALADRVAPAVIPRTRTDRTRVGALR
ncbi:glycosyltransferase [Rugosimonospora acidiphila]|uniref:glycosyltransferase n=1 Tax=Rugosimonospora acidiphila TaxID=556531 RepID=UPI0031F14FC0